MTQSPSSSSSPDGSSSRDCTVCSQPIPASRLAALPLTTMCVECVIAAGDPMIHRFDDYYGTDAEHCDSTFFMPGEQYMDKALRKYKNFGSRCCGGRWLGDGDPANIHRNSFYPESWNENNCKNPTYAGPASIVQPFTDATEEQTQEN